MARPVAIPCAFPQQKMHIARYFFSDGQHNGKRKALNAARAFRDQKFKSLGIYDRISARKTGPHETQGNNKSGLIGVFKYYDRRRSKNPIGWAASWFIDHKIYSKQFPSEKHTEKRAFELACIERLKRVGQLQIVDKRKKFPLPLTKIKKLIKLYQSGETGPNIKAHD